MDIKRAERAYRKAEQDQHRAPSDRRARERLRKAAALLAAAMLAKDKSGFLRGAVS
jgi:hypothetical protein